ncbi:carboxylesterase family protein [Pseudonocardia sp. WMMC193]|uniref:carboxylesterase family protein n=1 Tax=Pseudonocardia sp. WMMC193 TaxID=2911965 RepID=UPI001F1D9ABD|nr:carboxylesterase family protein [Pseudonocardia sp. WMMC193]MCF7552928.1 carboxylesterase family protein [Pseudonocardia sp. WMMC193]
MIRFEPPAGPVLGRRDGAVVRVRGVPYAHAARFGLPRPPTRFTEPFPALEAGPAARQERSATLTALVGEVTGGTVGEDCQRLTITLPADVRPEERLPVLVWIHGGSYETGAGDAPVYDPQALVEEQRLVVVTVGYRLGLLGYLGMDGVAPANLGLVDQLAALRWVHTNIAAFGGDPAAVTVAGQSAGGDAVAHLMISDGARGLFRRAIVQSAPLATTSGRSRMGDAMARAVGTPPPSASVEDLLALHRVAAKAAKPFGLAGGMPFGVRYGRPPLPPQRQRAAAWRACAPEIDLLIGATAAEAGLLLGSAPGPVGRALVAGATRLIYGGPARAFARRHRRAGGRAVHYTMTWAPRGSRYGAAHIVDLPLLFGARAGWAGAALLGDTPWAEVDELGRRFRAVWGAFVRTGEVPAPVADAARDVLTLS